MPNGLPTSRVVEIEFTAGVWTDVTAYAATTDIRRGRSGEFEDIVGGAMTVVLRAPADEPGRYIPINAASTVYPNLARGKRIRFRLTDPGVTNTGRFWGYIDAIEPDGTPNAPDVTLSCVDNLGMLAARQLRCELMERTVAYAIGTGNNAEAFPLDDLSGESGGRAPAQVQNIGNWPDAAPGMIVASGADEGTAELVSPSGFWLDGMLQFTPSANQVCPILRIDTTMTVLELQFGFVCSAEVPAIEYTLIHACGADNITEFRFTIANIAGRADLIMYNETTALGTIAQGVNTGEPFWCYIWQDVAGAGSFNFGASTNGGGTYLAGGTAADLRNAVTFAFGGTAFPQLPGKQYRCLNGQLGGVVLRDYLGGANAAQVLPGRNPREEHDRFVELSDYGQYVSPFSPPAGPSGTATKPVLATDLTGRNLVEAYAELCRTTGGVVFVSPSTGNTNYRDSGLARSTTVALTVDLEADGVGLPVFADDSASAPSRVLARWAGGTSTAVDADLEALGVRREESIQTCAADADEAYSVATYRLNRARRLRIRQVEISLVTSSNDLYLAVSNLDLGERVRVTGLPTALYGVSYVDCYLQGLQETHTDSDARLVLDLSPADDPPDAVFDSTSYGRFATDGSATLNAGITSSATTLAIATGSGPTFTTSGAEYPLDIDLNGERVTLNNAPGGSTSPQTFTGVTRGVAPTIARAHSAAEPVEVWNAAAFALG